ncbi:DUF4192 domain-containing protein [Kutzneria sp. CA-103260]|uniref:DUF4192 domain-containing protein n=1 Tax=Kutzneria sp. CA-103260 TaxID=2802641 RepID=UPI001BAB21B2|nr:DUF4192 domain-containing protein [Kutzneria sp. CA-103260]QUQ71885.1 hypothetical protein JJ691_96720 [Kutzneria sp. CA-103260]
MDTAARPNPDRIVKLADAGALIAAIPSLLGFHPANSFLVVSLKGGIISHTVRVDLPPPELHAAVVGRVMRPVRQVHAEHAVVLVVCADRDPGHRDLVRRAVAAMTTAGMSVLHALWTPAAVGGAPWRCYLHDHCEGEVPDPAETECAAAMTLAGLVTFESRDELARILEPPDADRMIRLSGLLDVTSRSDRTPSAEHLSVVRAAVESGVLPATDEEFVRLALAVSDHRVRDACLGFILDAATNAAAEKLWLELARCLPPPERAEAASLLAASAYLRGDGALANVALEQARNSQPDHNLAGLLQGAIDYGMPLAQLHQSFTDAAIDAHIDITTEPAEVADEPDAPADGPADPATQPAGQMDGPGDPAEQPVGTAEESSGTTKGSGG